MPICSLDLEDLLATLSAWMKSWLNGSCTRETFSTLFPWVSSFKITSLSCLHRTVNATGQFSTQGAGYKGRSTPCAVSHVQTILVEGIG